MHNPSDDAQLDLKLGQAAIETQDDEAPGPRFYCGPCAHDYMEVR